MKNISIVVILIVATLLSIFFIDRPLAIMIENNMQGLRPFLTGGVNYIEIGTGFTISKYFIAGVLLIAGLFFYFLKKDKRLANILFFIGLTHLSSRLIAGTLKNIFDRTRPFQFLKNKAIGDFFIEGGSAFPSGHVAHFFSLFIPLIFLFPKHTWWLLIIPVFVLSQRVISNDHYLGDTLASLSLIMIIATMFYKLLFKRSSHN